MDFWLQNPSDHDLPSYVGETSWHLMEIFLARPQLFHGTQIPRAKNQPQSMLCLGWRDGIYICCFASSPKLEQRCLHRYPRMWGTLSEICSRDKKSPLPADSFSQHLSLVSCFLLPRCKTEVHIILLVQEPAGLRCCFTYLPPEPLLWEGNITQQKKWKEKN